MRFNKLDLNLLVALDALLEEKKTIVVAQRLHVSQSAVSGMLARLRVFFEDDLLVQTGRQLELTPLGRELVDPVRELLMHIQATLSIRPGLSIATERRHFRITASDYAVPILIVPLFRRLQKLAPFVTLELGPPVENTGRTLRRGETDLLITPEQFLDAEHPHAMLFEDSFSCVAWQDNEEIGATLDLDTFLRCGHIAASLGRPRAPGLADAYFDENHIVRRIAMTTHDFASLAPFVVGTQLIATMQTRLALAAQARLPLRVFAPPIAVPPLRICMQWHQNHSADLAHRWLREQIIDIAQNELQAES